MGCSMRMCLRVLRWQLWFVLCVAGLWAPADSAEPQFSAEQRQQLEEAKRLNDQALKLFQQGRARDALVPARQALSIHKQVLGEKHPGTAQSLNALGVLQHSLGEYAEARAYCEQALAIQREGLGEKHPDTVQSLNNLGTLLKEMGDYVAARPHLEQALAIRKAVLGENHPLTAQSLTNLGGLLTDIGEHAAARPYWEQALAINKRVLGEKHPETATSLNNLGWLLHSMKHYAAARSYLEQAVSMQREVFGEKHPNTAQSLNNLGELLRALGDYAAARPNLEQALAIRKAALGENHPLTAQSLSSIGSLEVQMKDYAAARPYLEQALAIHKRVFGEKHPVTGTTLNNLGELLRALGDYAAARPNLEQALAINKEVLGGKHPATANSLNNLGGLLQSMGDHAMARPYFEQALAIRKAVLGENDTDTAASLNNLGDALKHMGEYSAARPYLEQALTINKKVLGEKHIETAKSLNSLGSLLVEIRDYAEARPYLEQALTIHKEVLGEKHLYTATSLNNLGEVFNHMGDFAAARTYLEQAHAIRKEVLGEKHPDTALLLNNLGALLYEIGDYAGARSNLEQALAIRKEVLGEKHRDTALSLNNLGTLRKNMGDDKAARPYYEQALVIRKEVLGEKHPDTARSLDNLATLEAAAGNWDRWIELTDEARHTVRAHLLRTLPGMAGAEQLRFLQSGDAWTFRAAVTLAVERSKDPTTAAMSAAWLVNGKGTAQEALAQQAVFASEANDPAIAESVKRLFATRRELANLVMMMPKSGQEEFRKQRLAKLESEEQSLAREVGRSTGRPAGERVWIELDEVRQAIAADAVLVDLVRYEPYNFRAKFKEPRWGKARYVAWLVPAAGQREVEIVDLGPAEEIEAVVAEFLEAIRETNTVTQTDVDGVLGRLADLVYTPLAGRLASARHWLVSPDGALWTVPWGALRLDPKTYAIEKHEISYLVSSRDLVNRPARGKSSEPVVMADPDFGLSAADAKAVGQEILTKEQLATRGDSTRSRDLLPKRWRRLEGTAAEAAVIEPQLQAFTKTKLRIFLRERALETVAKNVHGPRVLVLSTHGFFLPDEPVELSSTLGLDDEPRGKLSENPLLRCGIALAGANQLADGPKDGAVDDGLLTGLEIVACDLRGTELTVLSACQTGLGDVHSGQGVAGLRQAFQLAGSECVMASLWEVPDQETAELMKVFYENLAAGRTKAVALANAQRARIAWRRKQSLDSHPWFWAAFTVTGL
jgi:tetratricopeptide (TPR) repeat protein